MVFKTNAERQQAVQVAKQLFAEGHSSSEVARIMCISDSQVRSLKSDFDDTESNDK